MKPRDNETNVQILQKGILTTLAIAMGHNLVLINVDQFAIGDT